ncbi:HemK2/MTQ2 family protein methyltransferase [Streptacidiphilus sp. P02-A3a]|uniref:HemK2/MTQ2 family protein methyltransferase n=1 Tax=Streptacidiphilus sp. P02-A3a TaxID=2704468 RepID=UPI0015FE2582|nr:HemK2/MTQ2 family protein methyltransferase [Streptacidiphilus sp. P02-A3a]QMU69327.1 methyltransferase [Streptacidiphilus sp. P02-A3a]
MWLLRPPGVYGAQGDTALLIESLGRERLRPGCRVLEIGSGSGAVAVAAARWGAAVTAVDVSRRALATTWVNGVLQGRRISVRRGDLLAPVSGRRFDVVVSNPPYVPGSSDHLPGHGITRAWDAGPTGRALLDRICEQVPAVLAPGGVLLLVHSSLCDVDRTSAALSAAGLGTEVVARVRQPFGPVMLARAAWFEECGIIAPGQREEELVVVRGVRSR